MLAVNSMAQEYKTGLNGPAADEISRYIEQTQIDCYKMEGESKCRIAETAGQSKVFYGAFEASRDLYALAFLTYQSDTTGNAVDQMAVLFKQEGTGWKAVSRANNTIGTDPYDVRFGKAGAITFTGTAVGPNDSRANPTGRLTSQLNLTEKGLVFVKGKWRGRQ